MGLLFFLFSCQANSAVEAHAAEISPFVGTGLLSRPDETAGEILLRAHQFDVEAMVLTVVGYSRGVGGFPKEPLLASVWVNVVESLGVLETGFFVQLLYWEDRAIDGTERIPEPILSDYCTSLRNNDLASRFQQAKIFNIEKTCGRSGQEERSELHTELAVSSQEKALRTQEIMRLVRDLRSRQATSSDLDRLEGFSDKVLLFFAATTHNPATESPDWSTEHLLNFMNAQRMHMPFIFSSEPPTNTSARMEPLLRCISRAVMKRHGEEPDRTLYDIERAHSGDSEAVNAIIRYYREGSFSFIEGMLEESWMRYAALRGDSLNQLMLAVREFESKNLTYAWAWAKCALTSKDDGLQRLAGELLSRIEARFAEFDKHHSNAYFEELQRAMLQREDW